jgi:phosphopantetheinyl transferase
VSKIENLSHEDHIYIIKDFRKNLKALENPIFLKLVAKYGADKNFYKTPMGKPMILGPLEFSVAHSGDILLVGFSLDPIGVDIEFLKIRKQQKNIAKKYKFSNKSQNSLEEFYQEWTAREALIKMLGSTLAKALARIRVINNYAHMGQQTLGKITYFRPENFIAAISQSRPKRIKFYNL